MAKKEIQTITVKGKYASAIIKGSALDKEIKAKQESLAEYKEILVDKTIKIHDSEKSVRLQAEGTDKTALLTAARTVTMTATDDLKKNLLSGMYSGTVTFNRHLKIAPANLDMVIAALKTMDIPFEEVWDVNTTAEDLDKYRKEHGPDQVLGDATKIDEVYKVRF